MKTIKLMITTTFALLAISSSAMAGGDWLTDIEAGVAQAKKEKKAVMVEFTGSDWCPPCIMMHKTVFSKKAFTDGASKKYVLVKIDIPKADKALSEKNQKVLKKYKVRGVPTVILFSSEGKEFDRFTASRLPGSKSTPTVETFLAYLDKALEKKDMD